MVNQAQIPHERSVHRQYAALCRGHFAGPYEVMGFLNKFLPLHQENEPSPEVSFLPLVALQDDPRRMGDEFIKTASSLTPNLKYTNTYTKSKRCSYPTVSVYKQESGVVDLKEPDWTSMELWVDIIKPQHDSTPMPLDDDYGFMEEDDLFNDPMLDDPDPFNDEGISYLFEGIDDESYEARGRMATYCSALFDTQFRLHTFSIVIIGHRARLVYWDHCRAVVTELFEYGRSPSCPLAEFLVRYSRATSHERGYDSTVIQWKKPNINEVEYHSLTEDARKNLHRLQELESDNVKYGRKHREFRKMAIPDRDNPTKIHQVIVSYPPPYRNELPFGNGTRGMKCWNLDDGKILYAKDYWRPDDPYSQCEGKTYKRLEEAGVRNIPTFAFGNDVGHATRTSDLPDDDEVPHVRLLHYRMALKDIGQPLTHFRSSREFVSAIADAMEAHDDAYFKAGILHHDISVGNILFKDGKGMLIDWDLAVLRDDLKRAPQNPDRMGTWPFLSVHNIDNPKQCSDIEDDRESAFYVLLWVALKYTHHDQLSTLDDKMVFFDEITLDRRGNAKGAIQKGLYYRMPKYYPPTNFTNNNPLNDLIHDLRSTFRYRYVSGGTEEYQEESRKIMNQVKGESWLVGVFRKHLSRESSWPQGDTAKLNPFTTEELDEIRYNDDLAKLREKIKAEKIQK